MFRHPARNTFDLVAPICWFLYDNVHCCVVTRDGTFTEVLTDVRIAMEISCSCNRDINESPAAASFLVKSGCAISRTCGKKER